MQKLEIGSRARNRVLLAGAVAIVLAAATIVWIADRSGPDDRVDEVAARGAEVMPFDLERTTHRFLPRADGGLQIVIADDPGDAEEIALIRGHLADEADRFRAGDFGDPATIHG